MTDLINGSAEMPSGPKDSEQVEQLRLNIHITADFLDQVEAELVSIFYGCLMTYRGRFIYPKISSFLFAVVKSLSLFGLALSLVLLMMGGVVDYSIRIDIALIIFFSLMLAVSWNRNKMIEKLSTPYRPYWTWLAKIGTGRMLRAARKAAPFNAEYDFRGDLAVYYRTKNAGSKFVWVRRLKAFRLTGDRFTLFFKKENSTYPYAIILHDSSKEFGPYLDKLDIRPFERFILDSETRHPGCNAPLTIRP